MSAPVVAEASSSEEKDGSSSYQANESASVHNNTVDSAGESANSNEGLDISIFSSPAFITPSVCLITLLLCDLKFTLSRSRVMCRKKILYFIPDEFLCTYIF